MTDRIAILGAGGFIGNRAVEMLTLGGQYEVRPVVRSAQSLALASRFALDGRIADGRDEGALRAAFAGCTAVIHAMAGDPQTIVAAIEPVYRAAGAAGVKRLIYLSSASVHGQSPAPGTTEQSPLSDRQPIEYNNAKVRAERLLMSLRQQGNVEITILRPGIVYGPRSYWIGGFADELLAGDAYLVDGGAGICNGIYVDNLIHAMTLALISGSADGEAYLLGDAETYSWAELLRPVADALGFSLDELPQPGMERPPGLIARLQTMHQLRRAARALPRPLKAALRAGFREMAGGSAKPGSGPKRAVASLERSLLHRCACKLPHGKAAIELGYAPIVSFPEAQRRTLGWLEFAGYPVTR
ncbi:Hopanoid-associated sugar epimerase [Devosia sp. LC5]|uniref:NAD-dependent epimerase/dehydratase family protein n=1 Tax=Devosia sp. LC5 TaxID=1502724 RepID=UPI0004E2E702|nr:NAD(P)-dependent oxidoreductase [Devosia sp. LC5]KFC67370.1 Hopanoid-associated sugar epimerase [Devosia sp. LC5]